MTRIPLQHGLVALLYDADDPTPRPASAEINQHLDAPAPPVLPDEKPVPQQTRRRGDSGVR